MDFVWGDFVLGGFCPGGFCPGILSGGFCPGGFCPRTVHSIVNEFGVKPTENLWPHFGLKKIFL